MNIKDLLKLFKEGKLAIDVQVEDAKDFTELCEAMGIEQEEGKRIGLRKVLNTPQFGSLITSAKQSMDKVRMADLKGWQSYV